MSTEIKLEQFQGPLDLLLQLIEQEKLNITEVSLSQITKQYLNYLEKLSARGGSALAGESGRSEELADFLLIATRLVYMKSRGLLPQLLPEEDDGPSLAEQLKLYKQYIEVSRKVNILWNAGRLAYGRSEPPVKPSGFVMPANAYPADLRGAIMELIKRLRPLHPLAQVVMDKALSVKEKIKNLREMLKQCRWFSFTQLAGAAKNRTELIVNFLALLELVKEEAARVRQGRAYGEMTVERIR